MAELAEACGLTQFRDYQKNAINAALNGKDTLIIQQTGVGRVFATNSHQCTPAKAIVICPTSSLMQDQHAILTAMGIKCTYLGSAQVDKTLETSVFQSQDPHRIIFDTPEWLFRDVNLKRVVDAAAAKTVTLIAVDEAHLICEWQSFRTNYKDLETIKQHFPTTPVMFLTATATPSMVEKLKACLHDPCVWKGTVNRPKIILDVQEITDKGHVSKDSRGNYTGFANSVSKIIKKDNAIVYTDFIADIASITQALNELGITCAHFHGDLDAQSKLSSYRQWTNGEVQLMVATKAFGMGINNENVRHVIRNGVPPNINTWVQELGRAGRNGQAATATILYSESDVQNVLGWLRDHLRNRVVRDTILSEYDTTWKLVYCKLAGKGIHKMLLEYYDEELQVGAESCCGVCDGPERDLIPCTKEARSLVQAVQALGSKGECKVSEFLRGSNSSWLTEQNKEDISYGAGRDHSLAWWRIFIRQCHCLGIIDNKVSVQVVSGQQHAVCTTIHNTAVGHTLVSSSLTEDVLLPQTLLHKPAMAIKRKNTSLQSPVQVQNKGTEWIGKGSHTLYTIQQLMKDVENWVTITNKEHYHYPGTQQVIMHCRDITALPQYTPNNPHFLWADIQLEKGSFSKDRLATFTIGDAKEELYYRTCPCKGVKVCPIDGCSYTVTMKAKKPCPKHVKHDRQPVTTCPVEFIYLYPPNPRTDNRRWIGGILRNIHEGNRCENSLHSHPMPGPSKISTYIKEKIQTAARMDDRLTATQVQQGKGLGFVPASAILLRHM